jgi:CRISPR-associated protein Cas1
MAAQPLPQPDPEAPQRRNLPDYMPARMVNEFVYCPRLFFYEWVESLFAQNADTLEGKAQHARVDSGAGALPGAADIGEETIHSRSVTLSSDTHRLIARMDLVEARDGLATPVDYKHGQPCETDEGIGLWEPDKVQLAVQGIVLRDNGYQSSEGIVYYAKTKQRVRVPFNDQLISDTLAIAAQAWDLAERGRIPPPLEDSPKCTGCSLSGICLPDETNTLLRITGADDGGQLSLFDPVPPSPRKPPARDVRRLVTPRSDLRPVYLNTQGLRIGKSGAVLQVKEKNELRQEVRLGEICQLNLMGNIQVTTQAIQALCEAEVPVCYFSQGGWFYGVTSGMNTKNVFLRKAQFRLADSDPFCRKLSAGLVAGKIRNQRTMLLRNHIEPPESALAEMKEMAARAERAATLDELLGLEGNAARLYFGAFSGLLKAEDGGNQSLSFDFHSRNRRPPKDPVNALLSYSYSLLVKDLTVACYAVGFDPLMGFFHQPRFGRPALALDLMEPMRPLIADSAVITAINNRMLAPSDFLRAGNSVAMTPDARKKFLRAYELRMDSLVTHPLFEYRVSYRRLLEIQARLLARVIMGEIGEYPVFVTR